MSVSIKHVLSQGPVLRALGTAAFATLQSKNRDAAIPATPGRWHEETIAPRVLETISNWILKHHAEARASVKGI